jgi:ureidoglycolate lyase
MKLTLQALTRSAFAPYGDVIEGAAAAPGQQARPVNGGTSQRVECQAAGQLLAQGGAPALAVFSAQAQDHGGPWRTLERHRLGSQSFVPLAGARCIVLVALGADRPDANTLAAFLADGRCGFTLHAGTWHHGLIALDAGDFVVLERQATEPDSEFAELAEPVWIKPAS